MNGKSILFLLVNYFNEREVAEFISSQLGEELKEDVQVIVINNGSNDSMILKDIEQKLHG